MIAENDLKNSLHKELESINDLNMKIFHKSRPRHIAVNTNMSNYSI